MAEPSLFRNMTLYTVLLLLLSAATKTNADAREYAPFDGFRNNLNQPPWGIAGSNFLRGSSPAYSDSAYQMAGQDRPNPLDISLALHVGPSGQPSTFGRNAMQAFFAQLVLDELATVSTPGCPPEYENMPLPAQHPLRNMTSREHPYTRSGYDQSTGYSTNGVRQQNNLVSSFLDGGVIYGTTRVWSSLLRSYSGGKLLADSDDLKSSFPVYNSVGLPLTNAPVPRNHELKPADRLFRLGNAKGHENPFLLALQVIWFRWHNKVAEDIAVQSQGSLNDEEIFQAARRKVVAHFQKIAVTDWLPAFLCGNGSACGANPLTLYEGYDSRKQPGITHEFLAAMNFRHTISPGAVWTLSDQCQQTTTTGRDDQDGKRNVKSLRLCNNFWDPQEMVKSNLNQIIKGMLFTLGEREDGKFVRDFTEFFYGPYEYSRTDHVASQIQLFRDHGLPGLNTIRLAYGLQALPDWATLGGLNGTVHTLYGGTKPDNVDILTGGLLDQGTQTAGMSDLFRAIIVEQFERLRDGDRFWYQNSGMFNTTEINEIESVSFKVILISTTNLTASEIQDDVFLCQTSGSCNCVNPPNVDNTSNIDVDVCTPLRTHDYIVGSEWSFALSFLALGLVPVVSGVVLFFMVKKRQVVAQAMDRRRSTILFNDDPYKFAAREYLGKTSGFRDIRGQFMTNQGLMIIRDTRKRDLRHVHLKTADTTTVVVHLSSDKDMSLIALKVPGDIDVILDFADQAVRQRFLTSLESFTGSLGLNLDSQQMSEVMLYSKSSDKDRRQKLLDKFFRTVCLTAFEQMGEDGDDDNLDINAADEVVNVKLTMTEFADALGMQPSSLFVKNIFMLANKNNDPFMSFQEFLYLFGIFLKGSAEQKGHLLFNIYDTKKTGKLSREEFHRMMKSMLELAESPDLTDTAVDNLVTSMFRHVGLDNNSKMTYAHFHKIFCADEYAATLQNATISSEASKHAPKSPRPARNDRRQTFIKSYRARRPPVKRTENGTSPSDITFDLGASSQLSRPSPLRVSVQKRELPKKPFFKRLHAFSRFVERYRLQIFWALLYTFVTIGIFVERAYFFARGREHAGLRRMSGAWVTAMIRGSASVIMFTYVSLLVTMCRNTITALRETFLHRFIPFDSAVAFHKYIAVLAIIGTVLHIVTHAINLYCMCTQSTASINCFFREYYTSSDSFAPFHYWAFQTITGLAGVLVTVLIFVMYVFATQYSRRHVFKAFWFTHSLYWLVYVLTFLHGVGRLVQAPLFSWYLIGPLVLFTIDRLCSISRNKVDIAVTSATPLPSGVLRLVFKRPASFSYKSGQWVRIACTAMSKSEYHPFTLTSAPHEPYLSLHIRAVGPWTTNLRTIYSADQNGDGEIDTLPHLYLDGPFGEGHQDWYTCEVAVLVGGGIGVTPFASILKDIAFKSKSGMELTCKKVYFIWVTRTQRSFEWLVDIIRQVEKADIRGIVSTHIFVTQFQQKYDLRTTMLYICERHFQKVEGQSLFTGLKAVTHFGRPQFEDFFFALTQEHKEVSHVGVFSCGPGPMTASVQKACSYMNSLIGPTFTHHFENF